MTFGIGEGGWAYVVPLVMSLGAATVGTLGTVVELAVKEIDKEKRPILRTIGEVFAKTLQTGSAALALIVIGSLFANPIGLVVLYGIGATLILTPIVHGVIKHTNYESLKKGFDRADKVASLTAKTLNSAVLTAGIFMSWGIPAAGAGGIGLIALNIATYKKA